MGEPASLPLIRVQLLLRKKPDVTDAFFHNYWRDNHVKLALQNKTFVDRVVRYNQFHTSPRLKAAAAADFQVPVPEYDGIAEVWVKDVAAWQAVVTDPEFVAAVAADEKEFLLAPIHVMLGYDYTVIGEGVGVEGKVG